jgi:hypothetical protein
MITVVADSITSGGLRLTTLEAVVYAEDYHLVTQPREVVHTLGLNVGNNLMAAGFYKILLTSSNWRTVCDYFMATTSKRVGELGWAIRKALQESKPALLEHGMWHLPYVDAEDHQAAFRKALSDAPSLGLTLATLADAGNTLAARASVWRCSQMDVQREGNRIADLNRDLALFSSEIESNVTRLFYAEHQFTPDLIEENRWLNFNLQGPPAGWIQYRHVLQWDGWRLRDSSLIGDQSSAQAHIHH